MRVTVAGSGTAAPEPDRVCSGYFVRAGGSRLLMDCGPGVVHHLARFGLAWAGIDHLLITHFHNDHIGDIPMLLFAMKWGVPEARTRPLTLWGPAGLRQRLRSMAVAFGDHVADPGFPVDVREVEPGQGGVMDDVGFQTVKTPHTDESMAFRLEHDGVAIGYTGDTGYSDAVAHFLVGVHVMIAECSLPDDEAIDTHLTPSRLAAMATAADPGRLLVTHVYPQLARQDVAGLLREAGWTGTTVRAEDGLALAAGPDGPVDGPRSNL